MFWSALPLISFVLHALWERAHIVLYTDYDAMEGVLPVWLVATLGDVLYTLVAVGAVSVLRKYKVIRVQQGSRCEYGLFFLLGFGIALFVEYKALALHKWAYLPAMPLIPYLNVGLSPILQMTLLLPLSVFLSRALPLYSKR